MRLLRLRSFAVPLVCVAAAGLASLACSSDPQVDGNTSLAPAPTPVPAPGPTTPAPTPDPIPPGPVTCPAPESFGDARLDALAASLTTLDACPTRAWTNFSWHDVQVVFVSQKARRAFFWNDRAASCKGFLEVDYASLPPDVAATQYFGVFEHEGAAAVSVRLDLTAQLNGSAVSYSDTALALAVHEGFHFVVQPAWYVEPATEPVIENEDPPYPDSWRLRYLRDQLGRSLLAALERGAPLGAAAHWRGLVATEFPAETRAAARRDVAEGSAQYVSATAEAVSKLGCDASDDAVRSEVLTHREAFLNSIANEALDAGSEAYDLGLLAGLVAAREGAASFTRFADATTRLTTPVDALLESVAAVATPDDPAARERARTKVEASNASAGTWIDPLLARFADPSATRIPVPALWQTGAFRQSDSYALPSMPGNPSAVRSLSGTFREPKSQVEIRFSALDVLDVEESPCGRSFPFVAVIPTETVTSGLASGRLTLAGPGLTTTALPVVERRDANGRAWLCPGG